MLSESLSIFLWVPRVPTYTFHPRSTPLLAGSVWRFWVWRNVPRRQKVWRYHLVDALPCSLISCWFGMKWSWAAWASTPALGARTDGELSFLRWPVGFFRTWPKWDCCNFNRKTGIPMKSYEACSNGTGYMAHLGLLKARLFYFPVG